MGEDFSVKSLIVYIFAVLILGCLAAQIVSLKKNNNTLRNDASKQLDFLYYGEEDLIDQMIEVSAKAKGWNFISQNFDKSMVETGNLEIPYFATFSVYFQNPQNKNITHIIKTTYIYDSSHNGWVPLSEILYEMDSDAKELTKKLKIIRSSSMWQGDFDMPFFKK